MLKAIIKKVLRVFFPYQLNQRLIRTLIKWSYGIGGDYVNGGELIVLKRVRLNLEKKYHSIGFTLFDVGANIGGYSLELAREFGCNTNIYAFEPLGSTFKMLSDNTKSVQNIHVFNIGMSNQATTMPVYTNAEGSGMTSVYHRRLDHFEINMNIKQDCSFSTIDDFCCENTINHIHFLKIDVEGHELSVLKGAKGMIGGGKVDFIQFEFGGCDIDSRTFFQDFWYLLKDSFDIYRIYPNSVDKVVKYDETMEIFVCTNFIAVRKDFND